MATIGDYRLGSVWPLPQLFQPSPTAALCLGFSHQPAMHGDVAGNASSFIKSQRLGDLSIALIGVAVDVGERLTVRVHDLEAAV